MLETDRFELVIAEQADLDAANIADWTRDTFGAAQTTIYMAAISKSVQKVLSAPKGPLTKDVPDAPFALRTYAIKHTKRNARHILMYRVQGNTLELLRIVHEKMDIDAVVAGIVDEK
jgi:toxin ParE1/3/4